MSSRQNTRTTTRPSLLGTVAAVRDKPRHPGRPAARSPPPAPLRFPQRAPSGWCWSGEGPAAGRSRRDAKRPSRDRGSRHADRGGQRVADNREPPTSESALRGHPPTWPRPHPVPERFNKTHLFPNTTNYECAAQGSYSRTATGAQSRGGSSRWTRTAGRPPAFGAAAGDGAGGSLFSAVHPRRIGLVALLLASTALTACGGNESSSTTSAEASLAPAQKAALTCTARVETAFDSMFAFMTQGQDAMSQQVFSQAQADWGEPSLAFTVLQRALSETAPFWATERRKSRCSTRSPVCAV